VVKVKDGEVTIQVQAVKDGARNKTLNRSHGGKNVARAKAGKEVTVKATGIRKTGIRKTGIRKEAVVG